MRQCWHRHWCFRYYSSVTIWEDKREIKERNIQQYPSWRLNLLENKGSSQTYDTASYSSSRDNLVSATVHLISSLIELAELRSSKRIELWPKFIFISAMGRIFRPINIQRHGSLMIGIGLICFQRWVLDRFRSQIPSGLDGVRVGSKAGWPFEWGQGVVPSGFVSMYWFLARDFQNRLARMQRFSVV
jgi:hypothetical protein